MVVIKKRSCKIGVFESWTWEWNTISSIEVCCAEMGNKLIGKDRDYVLLTKNLVLINKVTKQVIKYCPDCGGKIEFYKSHDRCVEWKERYLLKLHYTNLMKFNACCEGLAAACRDSYIVFDNEGLRLGGQQVRFCFSCGKALELLRERET